MINFDDINKYKRKDVVFGILTNLSRHIEKEANRYEIDKIGNVQHFSDIVSIVMCQMSNNLNH